MQVYKVGDKEYRVICSVHRAIKEIVTDLNIDKEMKDSIYTLLDIANDMAVNMENAIERKKEFNMGIFGFKDDENDGE